MKKIQLNKGTLELPDCWEDLTMEQLMFTIGVMSRLLNSEITPDQARIEMLINYTGYVPSRKIKDAETRENINFNLLKLSEMIDFAFTVEENVITPAFSFKRNPLPSLTIDGVNYPGKIFNLDVTAKTNITAKEFADAFDLMAAMRRVDEQTREELLNQIGAILYPSEPTHDLNMVGPQIERMRQASPEQKSLILFWFMGIVNFYTKHPVYSLLFSGKKKEDADDKISLGMTEVTLHLRKSGYGNPDTMNLNEYFDAQVKSLKDSLSEAVGKGAKIEDIAKQTGISYSTINRLI